MPWFGRIFPAITPALFDGSIPFGYFAGVLALQTSDVHHSKPCSRDRCSRPRFGSLYKLEVPVPPCLSPALPMDCAISLSSMYSAEWLKFLSKLNICVMRKYLYIIFCKSHIKDATAFRLDFAMGQKRLFHTALPLN